MLDCIGAHASEGCFWLGAIGRDHLSQIRHDFGREPTLAFEAMKYRKRTRSAIRNGCALSWVSEKSMTSHLQCRLTLKDTARLAG